MSKKQAVFPGSFDPITIGHLDIIERSSALFDSLTVLISENIDKRYLLSVDQRKMLIEKSVSHLSNVTVDVWGGLTVDYMQNNSISVIVRGVRNTIDFEIENQLALINKKLYIDCETVLLSANPNHIAVSSTFVRDLLKHNGDISEVVPALVADELKK